MADSKKPNTGSARDDVLAFLDDLDSYSAAPSSSTVPAPAPSTAAGTVAPTTGTPNPEEAAKVLEFLDEITARSSTPTTQLPVPDLNRTSSKGSLRGAGQGVAIGPPVRKSTDSQRPAKNEAAPEPAPTQAGGGWGWSSMWNSATSVIQQAQSIQHSVVQQAQNVQKNLKVDEVKGYVKGLAESEQAKKWTDLAKNVKVEQLGAYVDVEKLGQMAQSVGSDLRTLGGKTFHDILNAVAPPIAEHELIEVTLSHDMAGYDGVEALVYAVLVKIMEQVEGGDLVINKGKEDLKKEDGAEEERNLNFVEGKKEGFKLAKANLEQLVKTSYIPPSSDTLDTADPTPHPSNPDPSSSLTIPVTKCPIFLRIQPVLDTLPIFGDEDEPSTQKDEKHLFFIFLLEDPGNKLSYRTITQSLPADWLDIPFEENEWVEDIMVEILRRGTEVIGQQYINTRMTARKNLKSKLTSQIADAVKEKERTDGMTPEEGKGKDVEGAMLTSPAT
ncbi:hypothetical protein BT69DRAFT_1345818 [Atractiella rhizophila]|nr:hypothetical protein BT69DRAFT_1345818 [Atractiella rhizophila]